MLDGIKTEEPVPTVTQSITQVLVEQTDKQEQVLQAATAIVLKDGQAEQVEEKTMITCHLIQLFIYGKELNRKECPK